MRRAKHYPQVIIISINLYNAGHELVRTVSVRPGRPRAQEETANIGFFANLNLTSKHLYLECFLLHHVLVWKSQLDSMKSAFRDSGVLKVLQGQEQACLYKTQHFLNCPK